MSAMTQAPRFLPEAGHVAELDALVAADQVGQAREPHGRLVGLGRERGERLLDERPVLGDERPLQPPHPRVAEGIERGAAQAAQADEEAKERLDPPPHRDLSPEAHRAQSRRLEVVAEPGGLRVLVLNPPPDRGSWGGVATRTSSPR